MMAAPTSFSKDRYVEIYKILLDLPSPLPPPKVAVITDIGKDYDDLTALVILKELHRLGFVQLVGVVANLHPSQRRARFARGALKTLGLESVAVAYGTKGSVEEHQVYPYEFEGCQFEIDDEEDLQTGNELLTKLYLDAARNHEKLTLLLISSLQDIAEFAHRNPDLVINHTSHVHIQGGNFITPQNELQPDPQAANNLFHLSAATAFHAFLSRHSIPSTTYTRAAAIACALPSEFFAALARTGHPLGLQLQQTQQLQEIAFYATAREPLRRFSPDRDGTWFLKTKTSWFDPARRDYDPQKLDDPPVGKEIVPYLTKVVVYDAIAALGAAGERIEKAFGLFEPARRDESVHQIIGISPQSPGVHAEVVKDVLGALSEGAVLSALQGMPSHPS
jgi:hypothetical protein